MGKITRVTAGVALLFLQIFEFIALLQQMYFKFQQLLHTIIIVIILRRIMMTCPGIEGFLKHFTKSIGEKLE